MHTIIKRSGLIAGAAATLLLQACATGQGSAFATRVTSEGGAASADSVSGDSSASSSAPIVLASSGNVLLPGAFGSSAIDITGLTLSEGSTSSDVTTGVGVSSSGSVLGSDSGTTLAAASITGVSVAGQPLASLDQPGSVLSNIGFGAGASANTGNIVNGVTQVSAATTVSAAATQQSAITATTPVVPGGPVVLPASGSTVAVTGLGNLNARLPVIR